MRSLTISPPDQVHAVRGLIETMLSPLERKLAFAPADDEPVTGEELAAMDQAIAAIGREASATMEEVLAADFGLTVAEFERLDLPPLPGEPRRDG